MAPVQQVENTVGENDWPRQGGDAMQGFGAWNDLLDQAGQATPGAGPALLALSDAVTSLR